MSDKSYKKYLIGFFVIAFAVSGFLAGLNWRIDPLQFYRKAAYTPFFTGGKRFQNPGLAKNYEYDAIINGTSLSENFKPIWLKERLGWNALNFSMRGGSAYEQRLALELALKTGKVKNVIWDINYEYLRGDSHWVANYDGTFPAYFYDENPFNEISNYLLNIDTTKSTLKIILQKMGINTYGKPTIDDVYTEHWDKFCEANVRRSWKRYIGFRKTWTRQIPEFAATNLISNFDNNFLKVIKEHPEVSFHLFHPPFTLGYYAHIDAVSPEVFQAMLELRRHVYEETRDLKNVEIYDFQAVPEIITNMDNYCDLMHFSPEVNAYILDSIRMKRHLFRQPDSADLRAFANQQSIIEWVKRYGG